VLVNNAGTAIPKLFEESTLEEMDRVLDINVRAGSQARAFQSMATRSCNWQQEEHK
jgi:short-subunit dehydrogenase